MASHCLSSFCPELSSFLIEKSSFYVGTPARFTESTTGHLLGVAAVGVDDTGCVSDRDQVYLYDISDPASNDQFLTLFEIPGCAWTVSLFNGQAYVADTSHGLQVINDLAFDTGSVPPTVPVRCNGARGAD